MGSPILKEEAYRRFSIRLPIEYYRADSPINQNGQALDASEGGLQIFFQNRWKLAKT